MAISQKGRLLQVFTPFDDNFLLMRRFHADEGISQLFRFDLDLVHEETETNYRPTPIEVSQILGQLVTVQIQHRTDDMRFFNGIVTDFTQGHRDKRFSYYNAILRPEVWLLTQNSQSRVFQHMPVPEILKKVFEGYNTKFELQGTFEPRDYCIQYRESDFDFASRLMEEEGIYYFFEHTTSGHKMIIANTPLSHRDCPGKSDIPYFVEVTTEEDFFSTVGAIEMTRRLQTGKVTLWDHCFELPGKNLESVQPTRFSRGGNQELEIYDFPGGYAQRFDGVAKDGGDRAGDLQKIFEDGRRTAQIRMQELDAQYRLANGISDCCTFTAGYRFRLTKHKSNRYNQQYALVSVSHEAIQTPDYVSNDDIEKAYSNSFTCILTGSGQAPYRPPRQTRRPTVLGCQTATVVGPAGEEIFTDKYGRVKVQFHWDRDGKNNVDSSCWIRVAQMWAGKKWGSMYIPRIGHEVIVDFLEGDPDQPIIVGSVYNAETMPHYELPKFKTLGYIKSNSSPGGNGFNEIRFEDKAGKEQVFVHSQKRMDVRVKGSVYETCGGNRQISIGMTSDPKNPGGNLAVSVGANLDLHVKKDTFVGIDGKLNMTVKGEVIQDFQNALYTQVGQKAELNAQEITLEAMTKISLKVGGSFITIDLSGVTISGPMVKINSGGAAMGTSPHPIDDPLDAEAADTGEPGYLDKPRSGGGRGGRNRRTLTGKHAPPFQTRKLPNGDIQVGNNITIKKSAADPNFQDKVLKDMTTMSNYPTGMDRLNNMNNAGQPLTIERTTGGNSYVPKNAADGTKVGSTTPSGKAGTGKGTGGTIKYNPDREPPTAADPTVKRPADVGLHHEMSHAQNAAKGEMDWSPDPANPNNPHKEETKTIDMDNQYRDERGIPRRRDHTTL